MRRLLQAFGAPRVTIALMVALGTFLLAGLWIPQKSVLNRDLYLEWKGSSPQLVRALELVGLTDVHRSPIAVVIWGAFFLNLVVAVVSRAPGILRRAALSGDVPAPGALGAKHREILASALPDPLSAVAAFFSDRGYAVKVGDGRIRAVRHRLSAVATLAFHLSFVVMLAGGTASVLTRFDGFVHLGEGEEFRGDAGQYEGMPRVATRARWPGDRFTVERIAPRHEAGVVVDVTIVLRTPDGEARRLWINHPYDSPDGVSYVFKDLGFAPVLVLATRDGQELQAGGFRLDVLNGRIDNLVLAGLKIRTELFPDWYEEAGADRTRGPEVKNPVLRLAFVDGAGQTVSQRLPLGGAAELGQYQLHFVDWRYWVKLYVRSERGIGVLFAGFALAAIALAWRLIFFRRDYVVAVTAGGLEIAGRADFYTALFTEEFDATVAALRVALGDGAAEARP